MRIGIRIKTLCLIATIIVSQGVGLGCHQDEPTPCREYFELPVAQREQIFRTFPLDRQLEIYRCGMKKKPPIIAMAYDIANRGEKIVPDLLKHLRSEKDEWMQNALIDVFRILSDRGSLRGREEVVEELRLTVSHMKIERIRTESEESLRKIEKNTKKV